MEEHIKAVLHVNRYEHKQNPLLFVSRIVGFGAFGAVFGALIEFLIRQIPNSERNKWACAGIFLLQLAIVAVVGLGASYLYGQDIDDWVMATWVGLLFALTFFNAQPSLSSNITCVI